MVKSLYYLVIILQLLSSITKAQKPLVDTGSFKRWTSVGKPLISNDGKYISYTISNQPLGGQTVVLQSVDGSLKKEFVDVTMPQFSTDGKLFLYERKDKGTFIEKLAENKQDSILDVTAVQCVKNNSGDWMLYYDNAELVIQRCNLKQKMICKNVTGHSIINDYNFLALVCESKDSLDSQYIDLLDFKTFERKNIWTGKNPGSIIFDKFGKQLAFLTDSETGGKSVSYYKMGMKNAVTLCPIDHICKSAKFSINAYRNWRFSEDGKQLFFTLEPDKSYAKVGKGVKVDVWNYKDPYLQSNQLKKLNTTGFGSLYSIDLASGKPIKLTDMNDMVWTFAPNKYNGDVFLVESTFGDEREVNWNPGFRKNSYLVWGRTGERLILNNNGKNAFKKLQLSPDGKYVVYYDQHEANYFSYNVKTGEKKNLTKNIQVSWSSYKLQNDKDQFKAPIGISGWLKEENSILINSRYDIWQIDLEGKQDPLNLTGSGERNTVYFFAFKKENEYVDRERLMIKAFNTGTQESGFYALDLQKKAHFSKLSMGPYIYALNYIDPYFNLADEADYAHAKDKETYLVCRQDVMHSPNYYFTKDFISFQKISDIAAEKSYNWITSELHVVKLPNGKISRGILYKPENFDPGKKYPVLFYFYQFLSDQLNTYLPSKAAGGTNFPIPYFVSNDYLVYLPDIILDTNVGEGALTSVEGAARYLARLPWVDSSRMGISGHSLGGYEANYIATHSKLFAAVVSGAGISSLISAYGNTWTREDVSMSAFVESMYKMEVTPWVDLKRYTGASPLFSADKVTAPILLMHNSGDQSVKFAQSLEFYIGLRRLGKKVWLLQYDGQNHVNTDPAMTLDLTVRIKQFFDHYLKDAPPPVWMTRGVPASMKGIDSGLALDTSGAKP